MDHFGLLAPLYDRVIPPPDAAAWRARLRLPVAGRLLDAGGGTARASSALRALVGQLVLADLSRPMLQQARAKGPMQPVQADAARLPFDDGTFERVLVVDALHHFVSRQRQALGELLRVLRPGGRLVIEEMDRSLPAVKLVALAETLALMHSHFFTGDELRALVAGYGLQARIENEGMAVWVTVDK